MASDPPPDAVVPSPSPSPPVPVEPKKEWAAAIGLMLAFALIGLGFLLFMRNG